MDPIIKALTQRQLAKAPAAGAVAGAAMSPLAGGAGALSNMEMAQAAPRTMEGPKVPKIPWDALEYLDKMPMRPGYSVRPQEQDPFVVDPSDPSLQRGGPANPVVEAGAKADPVKQLFLEAIQNRDFETAAAIVQQKMGYLARRPSGAEFQRPPSAPLGPHPSRNAQSQALNPPTARDFARFVRPN